MSSLLPVELNQKIQQVIARDPSSKAVFEELLNYLSQNQQNKRRKLPVPEIDSKPKIIDLTAPDTQIYKDLSFVLPDRKKGALVVTNAFVAVVLGPAAVDLANASSTVADHIFDKYHISNTLTLHLPDKVKPQWNFLVIAKNARTGSVEPCIQFTIQDQPASKNAVKAGAASTLKEAVLSTFSFTPQLYSTKESCFACHRGSKEGLLYLLEDWVFFGFKKPQLLFNVRDIESISYSSITRMTFNVTIKLVQPSVDGQEFEFSMIDQTEYDVINSYVVNNSLSNQSMSEARRAKQTAAKPEFSNELQSAMTSVPIGENDEGVATSAVKLENGAPATNGGGDVASSDDEEEDANYEGASSDSEAGSDDDGSDNDGEGSGVEDDEEEEEEEEEEGAEEE